MAGPSCALPTAGEWVSAPKASRVSSALSFCLEAACPEGLRAGAWEFGVKAVGVIYFPRPMRLQGWGGGGGEAAVKPCR